MSQWYEANDKAIEVDNENREFNVYVTHNDFGSIYVTLKFAQVATMMAAIEKEA